MEMIYTIEQLPQAAEALWKIAAGAPIIAFHGNMGSGKTTFIHAICNFLNIRDVVSSPTFSIINEYFYDENGQQKKIYHIDLYRLRDEQEAISAGVEDCLYSDHLCLIEWPERISSILPGTCLHVSLELINDQTRKLRIGDN